MRNASLAAVAAAGIVALTAPAHASEVGVVVTGESWLQPQLVAEVESWLGQHGHTLVRAPLPADAINTLNDCFVMGDQTCARNVVDKAARASSVLYARVDSHSNGSAAPDLTLTAYWFTRGHDTVTERKTCQRCTDQALRSAADDILKRLIGGGDLGHVILKSQPPGARIAIDGNPPIGITPLDWDLPPGPHTIAMDKPGYRPGSRVVVVGSNRSDLVVLTLPADDDKDRGGRSARMLPLGLMIGGGATLAIGAGLIAFSPGPDPAKRYYYRTWPAGIAVAAVGAAAAGVGAWLWFRSDEASMPVAAVTRDAAYVGWLGRF